MSEAAVVAQPKINRREVLWMGWLASVALATGGATGAILWFAYPIFRAGEFGGTFNVAVTKLPGVGSAPEDHPEGRYWLVNTDKGVLALYKVCVHLGCLYKWVPSNTRFECPCHGSKYQAFGDAGRPAFCAFVSLRRQPYAAQF